MTKRWLMVILVALFLTSLNAWASSITYTRFISSVPDDGQLSGTLFIPLFDAPAATLQSVKVTFTLGWNSGFLSLMNNSASTTAAFNNVRDYAFGSLTGTGANLAFAPSDFVNQATINLLPLQFVRYPATGFFADSQSQSSTTALPADLSAFLGIGQLAYIVYAENDFTYTSGSHAGNVAQVWQMGFEGTLTVEYDFLAPEPATMAFAGLGLLALGFLGRRFGRR
jgi:hypothetical protein